MLSTVKAFEMYPKHNIYGFYSRVHCFKLIDIYYMNNQKTITFDAMLI